MMALTHDTDISSLFDKFLGRETVEQDENSCEICGEFFSISSGIVKCTNCGIVKGNAIDYGAEWRNDSNNGEDKNRVGMPINNLLPESSYSIGVSFANCRHNKKIYSDIQRAIIWSQPHQESSLKKKFDNISVKCHNNGITDALIEFTQTIYNNVKEELDKSPKYKQKRGDNDQGLQAASLFYAFQEDGHPKTYKDIAKIFEIEPEYVSEGIKMFRDLMNKSDYTMKTNKYFDYIDGFCSRLYLEDSVKERIVEVADKANDLGILDSNTPTAIVAGCIYYVIIECGISSINKKTIEHFCKVSVPTITKVCDKLCLYTLELSSE